MRGRVRVVAAVVAALTVAPTPAGADSSSIGRSDPGSGSIDAGVYHYVGRWSGRRSNCEWDLYVGDSLLERLEVRAPVRKVVGGVEYRLFTRSCPGRAEALVWIGPGSGRRLVGEARDELAARLPAPAHRSAPPATEAYVQVPTWIWTATAWEAHSVTAWVPTEGNGTVWATTTATPLRLRFDPGDGSPEIVCDGPGTAWTQDVDPAALPPCGHVFRHTSLTAPDGTSFRARLSIDWEVSWVSSTGDGGPLQPITTSTPVRFQVGEIQALIER